jgi:hypothetical protein
VAAGVAAEAVKRDVHREAADLSEDTLGLLDDCDDLTPPGSSPAAVHN